MKPWSQNASCKPVQSWRPALQLLRLVTATGREAHVGVPPHVARKLITGNPYTLSLQSEQVTAVLRSIRDDIDSATLTVGAVFDMPDDTSVAVGESAALQVAETVGSSGGWLPVTSLLEASRGLWDVLTITPDSEGTTARPTRKRRDTVHAWQRGIRQGHPAH